MKIKSSEDDSSLKRFYRLCISLIKIIVMVHNRNNYVCHVYPQIIVKFKISQTVNHISMVSF